MHIKGYDEIVSRIKEAVSSSEYFSAGPPHSALTFLAKKINKAKDGIINLKGKLTSDNFDSLINDLPRHNSFEYINAKSLPEEYFKYAHETLDDPYVYIILSNTGSAASELISIFTKKKYNHVSLAFDKHLKTIISYNGGEKLYPPGLNYELLKNFNKKADASVIVYRLKCNREQKKLIIEKIRRINEEGSAYNLFGLVLKYSHKPNIMFCSQFVYKMLKEAGLHYFEKEETAVSPMDIIELDYQRRLEYIYEIKLSDIFT
jgi:hypothetical protein